MMTMMVAFRRRYITFLSRLEAKHGVHSLSIKVRKEREEQCVLGRGNSNLRAQS